MLNLRVVHTVSAPESIEWFIEDQASLRSHDSAPRPPPSPPSPVSRCLSFSSFLCHVSPVDLTDGRGGSGRGAKSENRKKAWPSINHSVLSDLQHISPSPPYYFPYVKVRRPKSQWVQNFLLRQIEAKFAIVADNVLSFQSCKIIAAIFHTFNNMSSNLSEIMIDHGRELYKILHNHST